MEVGDVLLESVIGRAVLLLEGLLSECAKLIVSSDLGVEGIKSGLKVCDELVKGLFSVRDGVVGHLVIPGFCVGGSSSSAHLVQGSHDLGGVRGVESGVQDEVGFHGLDPMSGIIVLSQKSAERAAFSSAVCKEIGDGAGGAGGAGPVTGGGFPEMGCAGVSGDEGGKG